MGQRHGNFAADAAFAIMRSATATTAADDDLSASEAPPPLTVGESTMAVAEAGRTWRSSSSPGTPSSSPGLASVSALAAAASLLANAACSCRAHRKYNENSDPYVLRQVSLKTFDLTN